MLLAAIMTLTVLSRPQAVSTMGASEVALARRVARGESAALGELYDAHHSAVRAFAQRLLGGRPEAEDLVQETFLSAPNALKRFEGRSSVRTFLVSIAANHARHHRRAVARRLGALERMHAEPRETTAPHESEQRVLAQSMQRLLDALPFDQRLAVVLCIIEDRTSAEAAEVAQVAEGTIRTRIFHARKTMRAMLEQELSDGSEMAR